MMAAINEYLALRRGAGFVLSNAQYLLGSFAAFAVDRQQAYIRTASVIDWASRAPSRLSGIPVTRPFASLRSTCTWKTPDTICRRPTTGSSKTRRVPSHLQSQIDRLILAATQLRRCVLRAQTYATLISLLAATGLRISEALHSALRRCRDA
ncbi:MAG: hypothetical protein IPJ08_18955 [Burkholderiales bacterium]|nr:hypothetical protein [Burkholderiales bacterium]